MRTNHDHDRYRGRLTVVLATYRTGQRLALGGVLSTGDLLRQRHDALRRLAELAEEPGLDQACKLRHDEASAEVAAS